MSRLPVTKMIVPMSQIIDPLLGLPILTTTNSSSLPSFALASASFEGAVLCGLSHGSEELLLGKGPLSGLGLSHAGSDGSDDAVRLLTIVAAGSGSTLSSCKDFSPKDCILFPDV